MSGTSYDNTCPRCGGKMDCYSDRKPWDMVSSICLDCGFTVGTEVSMSSLAVVNARREDLDLSPIPVLREPTSEWSAAGLEREVKGPPEIIPRTPEAERYHQEVFLPKVRAALDKRDKVERLRQAVRYFENCGAPAACDTCPLNKRERSYGYNLCGALAAIGEQFEAEV